MSFITWNLVLPQKYILILHVTNCIWITLNIYGNIIEYLITFNLWYTTLSGVLESPIDPSLSRVKEPQGLFYLKTDSYVSTIFRMWRRGGCLVENNKKYTTL